VRIRTDAGQIARARNALRPHLEQLVADVRGQLEPEGWKVVLEEFNDGFVVRYDHPLVVSHSYAINLMWRRPWRSIVQRSLTDYVTQDVEVLAMRECPETIEHPLAIHRIRAYARTYLWPNDVYSQIVLLLEGLGGLTTEEATWLTAYPPRASR
jgi:hypothetical protein